MTIKNQIAQMRFPVIISDSKNMPCTDIVTDKKLKNNSGIEPGCNGTLQTIYEKTKVRQTITSILSYHSYRESRKNNNTNECISKTETHSQT